MTGANTQQSLVEISVIIPTRNRLAFLKEAVASVLAQDYRDREVVVVDDASEDGTWEWLSSLQDPGVRILRMERHGERSAARNLGLKRAEGRYVIFLDDDDLLAPHALSYLRQKAKGCPEALAVVGAHISFDDRGNWYRPPHTRWVVKRKGWSDILFGCTPPLGQALIRTSALLAAGGWHEAWSIGEDHELWLRLASTTSMVLLCPAVVRKMRIHPGQTPLCGYHREDYNLRRDFVRRLQPGLQVLGWRIFRTHRLNMIAGRCLARSRYLNAIHYYLRAIIGTPKLLSSPLPAAVLLGGLFRALLGFVFGDSVVGRARDVKAFLRGLEKGRFGLHPGT